MCAGRSLIPGKTFDPLTILGRVKVGNDGVSSNWVAGYEFMTRGNQQSRRTFNEPKVDTEVIEDELIGEHGNALWSGVRRWRVKDRGEAVPYGDTIFVRQSSTRPVAPE
jgi:hypothetical protein